MTITVTAGTVTKTAYSQILEPNDGMGVWTPLMFDSTEFPDGQMAHVQIQAWTTTFGYGWWSMDAPIKNKFLFSEFTDWEIPGMPAYRAAERVGSKYSWSWLAFKGFPFGEEHWTPSEFCSLLSGSNCVYYDGHGNVNLFDAGWRDFSNPEQPTVSRVLPFGVEVPCIVGSGIIGESPVEPYRQEQIGDGYPPFNTTGQPGINFVYLEACGSGTTGDFLRFCYPYFNGYGKVLENQAVLAYNGPVYLEEYEEKAKVLFTSLVANQQTVAAARAVLCLDGRFHAGTPYESMVETDLPIYGKPNTRISGVYTGLPGPSVGWCMLSWPLL